MVSQGTVTVIPARPYEDYESLKKWLSSRTDSRSNNYNEIITHATKLTTGATPIEIEGLGTTGVTAISQIGRAAPGTIIMASDTDDNAYDDQTVTMVYMNTSNVSVTAVATFNTTSTTEVAFAPAVTDFYEMVSLTCSVTVEGGDNICVGLTGAVAGIADPTTCFGVILAAATTAVQANLHGVGNAYVRAVSNHASSLGKVMFFEYLSGHGEIKHGIGTTDGADGTVEIRCFEATDDGDGTTTTTTTTIKDFYRVRWLHTAATVDADTDEFLLCGYTTNGTTTNIYGIIDLADFEHMFTRYCCPAGYTAWIASWHTHAATKVVGATTDTFDLEINYTDRVWATNRQMIHRFSGHEDEQVPIPLAELADVSFLISDLGGAQTINVDIVIVEVQN